MNKAITIGAAIMMSLSLAACGSNSTRQIVKFKLNI